MTETGNRRSERIDKPGGDIIAAVDPILMRDRTIDIVRDAIIFGKLKSGQRVSLTAS